MATLLQSNKLASAAATSINLSIGNSAGNGSVDTTAGSLLVGFVVSEDTNHTMSASDNVNGAWNNDIGGGSINIAICTFPNNAGGPITVTASQTGAANHISIIFQEWSGVQTVSPLDTHPAVVTGTSVTTITSASTGTLAQANELVLTCCRTAVGVTSYAVQSPFTPDAQSPAAAYNACGYQIVSSTAAQTSTFNWTTSANCSVVIASYKLVSPVLQVAPIYSRKYILFNT